MPRAPKRDLRAQIHGDDCADYTETREQLTFGELEALARALLAVLLALVLARVAGQEAELLQPGPQFRIELAPGPGRCQDGRRPPDRQIPPPSVSIRISNLSAVSVASSGCRTEARAASVGK